MAISTQQQLANFIAEHHRLTRKVNLLRTAVNRPFANRHGLIIRKFRATVERYVTGQEIKLADLESRLDTLLCGIKVRNKLQD